MIVRTHMTPHPITLRVDSDFRAALRVMQEHSIHHLPVVGPDERVLGIVAERDLLLAALRYSGAGADVADVMHRDVVSVRDDTPITHAATLMARNAIGGLPVVDAQDRVVGIITETDIFRAFVGVLEAKTARGEIVATDSDDEVALAAPPVGRSKHMPRASKAAPVVPAKASKDPVSRTKAARR